MKSFEYVAPTSVDGAVERLSEPEGTALPLAGGMDLLGLMKDNVARPDRLVNLKEVEGADAIGRADDGGLEIGALVTLSRVAEDERIVAEYPALAAAAESVGTPQIRNRGTLGGNLCQRPRCWYFRSELFPCLKKGGDVCYAIGGDNRYHAIFGNDRCAIVHPSSTAPALLAHDATLAIAGPDGSRAVDAAEFFVRPDVNVRTENVLDDDEIVTGVRLPPADGWRSATYVVLHKQSHDWPLGLAAVALRGSGGRVEESRVVLGAVAPIPWRSRTAEAALDGAEVTPEAAEGAADAAVADATPLDHNGYKVRIARTAVKRAVLAAAEA